MTTHCQPGPVQHLNTTRKDTTQQLSINILVWLHKVHSTPAQHPHTEDTQQTLIDTSTNGLIYISLTGRSAPDSQFLQRWTLAETGQTGLKEGEIIQDQLHLFHTWCSGQTRGHFGPVLCGGLQMQDKTVPNRHTLVITDIQATCTQIVHTCKWMSPVI